MSEIKKFKQQSPIFGRAAITLGTGPHSSCSSGSRMLTMCKDTARFRLKITTSSTLLFDRNVLPSHSKQHYRLLEKNVSIVHQTKYYSR